MNEKYKHFLKGFFECFLFKKMGIGWGFGYRKVTLALYIQITNPQSPYFFLFNF
jgi:hypothetical protein